MLNKSYHMRICHNDQLQDARDAVRDLATSVEALAKVVASKASNGESFMDVSNELTRQVITLVFASGEVYALEQSQNNNVKRTVKVVKNGNRNYHNVRNALGRFASKSVI